MMFCPKCGSLLKPKNEAGKKILVCSCGFKQKKAENVEITEKIAGPSRGIEVAGEEEEKALPLTEAKCPKCGHQKAYYWLIQTRAGDEAETKFLKCEKCKTVWRDYS